MVCLQYSHEVCTTFRKRLFAKRLSTDVKESRFKCDYKSSASESHVIIATCPITIIKMLDELSNTYRYEHCASKMALSLSM